MRQQDYLKMLIALLLTFLTYIPTFIWMWDRWFAQESYYGHGVLIPLVSLYFIWQRRKRLKEMKITRAMSGIIFVAAGLFIHIICALLKVYFISGFSLVLVIYGIVLFFLGKEATRIFTFPIFFLLAMIPLPLVVIGNLIVKLKLFATQSAVFILNKIGFPSIRDGSTIRMPGSYIAIGAPCSGLRSLISLLTLGLIFAQAMKVSYLKKGFILLAAIPIALASNILRIVMLSVVNDLYGKKAAFGLFHDFSGFLVFAFAFLGLFFVGRMLEPGRYADEG